MNIALVCPDGLSIILFCKGIIRALRSIPGAKVFVICDSGSYTEEISGLGVSCISIPMYRWNSPWEDAKYFFRLWRAMRCYKCDLVLNFSTKPNIYGTFAGKCAGVKQSYMHVVGRGAGFEPRAELQGKLQRLTFIFLYRLACRFNRRVWFTNGEDRRFFVGLGVIPERSTVLSRNYLNISEYAPELVNDQRRASARQLCGLAHDEKMVIMVARMIVQKGIIEFAEASELLRRKLPKLKFVLVAPLETGSPDAVPEEYVREKEKNPNFRWLGFQQDVKRLYSIADLAVLPSYYKEGGYPRALLEPMAMGKAVITTTSEDCRGAVEEGRNGFLVPIRDAKALAEAIERVMSDDALRQQLGNYSRVKAERDFNEEEIVPAALRQLGLPVPLRDVYSPSAR